MERDPGLSLTGHRFLFQRYGELSIFVLAHDANDDRLLVIAGLGRRICRTDHHVARQEIRSDY